MPESLPAAVRRHAAAHPHAPWLFERKGLDWTWISWHQAAERLEADPAPPAEPAGPDAWLHQLQRLELHLLEAAAALAGRLGPAADRDIVVSGHRLANSTEQTLLAWATLTGAALLFEPDPAFYVPAAAWARPTVFQGTAAEIAALRREAQSFRPAVPFRRPRLPFGRLRALLPLDPLTDDDQSFWTSRGTKIIRPE